MDTPQVRVLAPHMRFLAGRIDTSSRAGTFLPLYWMSIGTTV
jgi:hypothetical protein